MTQCSSDLGVLKKARRASVLEGSTGNERW